VPAVAGVKRAREGSEPVQQIKKPAVKPSSKPLSLQLAEKTARDKAAALAAAKSAKPQKLAVSSNGNSTVAARPKVTAAAPPKISQFSSLMSASKKPGTSIAERAAKPKVEVVRKPETPTIVSVKKDATVKSEVPLSRPTASALPTSSFLGFLADMDKPKEAPTPKLEENPDESPETRAKRLRKESRRKLRVTWKSDGELVQTRIFVHDPDEETRDEDSMMRDAGDTMKEGEMLKHKVDIDDMDEDEDEMEYSPPSEVDYDAVGKELFESNFFKFGGTRNPESPVSEAQDKHEEGNLMSTYTSRDQPDTPKEPPEDADDDDFSPAVDFGEPSMDFVREREKQILAKRQAFEAQPQQPQNNAVDLSLYFAGMQPQQTQPQTWPQSFYEQPIQPQAQPALSDLQGPDLSKLMAVVAQAQQMQQGLQQPQPTSTPGVDPNLAGLLASFNQQAASQPGNAGLALPVGQGGNPNPWPGANVDSVRDQQPKQKKQKGHQGKGKAPIGPDGLPLNYKTQVCQFWLDGRCAYGDACTYKHEKE